MDVAQPTTVGFRYRWQHVPTLQHPITMESGSELYPVASLENSLGAQAHFIQDDHCYVLVLANTKVGERFRQTAWIFAEAFEVLKTLPPLK